MGIFDPQPLPSSPTSQSTTSGGIASWAQPYVTSMLNQGQQLANQGTTDLQNQVYASSAGMGTPEQFAQGTGFLNQAGQGMLGTTGSAMNYGQQGAGYGQQATGAGRAYQQMATDPNQMAAYMNPYIQQALNPQLQLLNQQQALAGQGIAAKATGQGAFGGNRAALAQGLNQQNYALAGQQAIGQGYNEAFKQAQQAQQFGADLGLRGLQTGIQGAQTGLQGVDTAQRGYAGATQAGVGLGNLGAQQGQYGLSKLDLQNRIANQQYNLPYQRLQFMQGLMSGLPVSTSTTQGWQAGPNKMSQTAGLIGTVGTYGKDIFNMGKNVYDWATGGGSDGYGAGDAYSNMTSDEISNMMEHGVASGGQITDSGVKRYAEGGITSINRRVMNDPTAYSPQTIDRSAQNNVLGGVTKLLALDTIAKQRAAMQQQQAMQAQQQQPILAQLQQQAMPMGIDSAESNLPQQYAGGGIIAFEEGGDVPFPEKIQDLPAYLRKRSPGFDKFLNAFTLNNLREQINQGTNAPVVAAEPMLTDAKADELGRYKAGMDSGIVIHPNAPRVAGPAVAAAPQIPTTSAYRPAETSGIDKLVKGYEDMIRGGDDFKQAESKAETNAMRKMFLGMMAGESPYALVNVGKAGMTAQEGLEKTQEGIQARKDKQLAQLMGLGLKGEDLKNAAKKMGIDEAELQAKMPMYAAEARYKNAAAGAKAAGVGAGGISAGSIGAKDYFTRRDMYKSFAMNPKSNPELFAGLPADVQKALGTKVGSPSYQRGLDAVRLIADKMLQQDILEARSVGAKKVPLSSIDD